MESLLVGNRREIFADGAIVEVLDGAVLKLHEPRLEGTAFAFDAPWEGATAAYCSLAQHGEHAYLYYRGSQIGMSDNSEEQVTCVAETRDGVHFERLKLEDGRNIVLRGRNSHNFSAFYDDNPDCAPDARYKAVAGLPAEKPGEPDGLFAYASPDGVRWRFLSDESVITDGLFDSQNVAFYDAVAGRYRCYVRYWDEGGKSTHFQGMRAIQSATSNDFLHWSDMRHNDYGAPNDEQFYTNAVVPCPGAEHVLLSFPKRFVPERKKLAEKRDMGLSEAVFMASRDGVHWPRLFKEAWIRPGEDRLNWGERSRMTARGLYVHGDGRVSVYVSGHYRFDSAHLDRFTLRPQGFVSLHGGWTSARALTKPLVFGRGELRLNAATGASGYVRVEARDEFGAPIPGYEMDSALYFGDEYDAVYPFARPFDALAGRPIRLAFELKDADVYAVRTAE